ncbi:MAG: hypothetical protein Q8850_02660, partial [Candidatus Phytoplasma australasiaticum]|nr:hypothetical protein [Candidatus Phytoplasma australasiaticum]
PKPKSQNSSESQDSHPSFKSLSPIFIKFISKVKVCGFLSRVSFTHDAQAFFYFSLHNLKLIYS